MCVEERDCWHDLFSKDLHSFELYVCALSVHGLVLVNTGRVQERLEDLQLELGLVLGTEFMSSGGVVHAFNHSAISGSSCF